MNKEDLAYIGCKLLALHWAVKALFSISDFASSWVAWKSNVVGFPSEMAGVVYFSLVPLTLYISVALLLWFGARTIVSFLIPSPNTNNESGSISLFQAQSVAFASVGILILLSSIPEIGGVLYKVYQSKQIDSHAQMSFDTQAQLFELILRIVLGVLLLFGSKGFSALLLRLRVAGMK